MNKIIVKSVLNKHKKRDPWFLDDYSVNPYSGCSFNCIYCYIRGSKYGENLTKSISAKVNASEILEKQLRRRAKKREYGIIALSTSTEPYQKIEENLKLTRKVIEVISSYRFPIHVLTKSTLVLRDLDVFKEIDKRAIIPQDLKNKLKRGVIVNFSFSTLDEKLTKVLEPGAPKPRERLDTLQKCKEEELFVGVSYIPVLPWISDYEQVLDEMIKTAKECGADFVFVGALTLFGNKPTDSKTMYYKFLKKYYPELIPKYKSLYRIFSQPPKRYQQELEEKSKSLCSKYKIKMGLINKN